MPAPRDTLGPHARLLLVTLVSPRRAGAFSLAEWDILVRVARIARLLGVLRARFEREALLESVPPPVRAHFDGAWNLAAYRRQMILREMHAVERVLATLGAPLILLKGGAYIAQRLRCAEGRPAEDLDLLVPRDRLDEVERALVGSGCEFEKTDPYDQHFYRAWSHELPPMRFPGHAIELDVHHTILPPTGRVRPDARALIDSAVPIPGTAFKALSPADQVLHACAHLFQDSDCAVRLRDLVDIDALLREYAGLPDFWDILLDRASVHRLGRCVGYATRYCASWLDTPVPGRFVAALARFAPNRLQSAAMDPLVERALFPHSPDEGPTFATRLARLLLLFRAAWLRMPPWLLAYHSLAKLARGLVGRWRAGQAS